MTTKLLLLIGLNLLFLRQINAQTDQTTDCQTLNSNVESYLNSSERSNKKNKEIFKAVKTCAESGDAEAACNLGILYKDGIGCKLDFDRSKSWFEVAYGLGNQKAAYSLGYLYLKGLGGIPQDYIKAVQWFAKSDYPMAKHWLAQCYYFGYGVLKDKQKALQMLKDNPIGNSQVLLTQLNFDASSVAVQAESSMSISSNSTSFNDGVRFESISINAKELQLDNIAGDWFGEFIEMDWSGKNEVRRLPVSLEIIKDEQIGFVTKFIYNDEVSDGFAFLENSSLVFPDSYINLPKKYTDHPEKLTLDYRLLSLKFQINRNTLTGRLETNVENWSEPGPPIYFQLNKSRTGPDENALEAFKTQEKDFIKVYPNPFEDDVLIRYSLKGNSNVRLSINDYYGRREPMLLVEEIQKAGEQTLSFDRLAALQSGLYVIRLEINDTDFTKIVIKK